ncbi:hypothetical protein BJX76DRAFT_325234 [Aspergillus varians]
MLRILHGRDLNRHNRHNRHQNLPKARRRHVRRLEGGNPLFQLPFRQKRSRSQRFEAEKSGSSIFCFFAFVLATGTAYITAAVC